MKLIFVSSVQMKFERERAAVMRMTTMGTGRIYGGEGTSWSLVGSGLMAGGCEEFG